MKLTPLKRAEIAMTSAKDMDHHLGLWGYWKCPYPKGDYFHVDCVGEYSHMRAIVEKKRSDLVGDVTTLPIWC